MNTQRLIEAFENSKHNKMVISRLSNVSRTTIDNLLSGMDVKVSTIENIAKTLNKPVGYFFDDDPLPEQVNKSDLNASNPRGAIINHKHYNLLMELKEMITTLKQENTQANEQKEELLAIIQKLQEQNRQLTELLAKRLK